ncbi:MAG: TetR/AcrR family transcriptional regulator [Proteobacteria bacterium]|nr:TetR/AcrR family transcriptional regulator [Pseudomonadota bacterium]
MAKRDTKNLFLETSNRLFRSQGFSGTGLKQIVSEAGVPWGSLYHFFPGGKDDLGMQTVAFAGNADNELFKAGFAQAKDLPAAVAGMFKYEIQHLNRTDFQEGCAVASVASDVAAVSEPVREACSRSFADWEETISDAFLEQKVNKRDAKELASFIISALEGATLLSRTKRSIAPMKNAMKHVDIVVQQVLKDSPND